MLLEKLKEMFANMVLLKDAALIPHYYHEDFLLHTNGQEQNYEEFLTSHIKYYASSKEYSIVYDDESFLENQDKVAGRVWITVTIPGEKPKKMEVILIVKYKEGKIYRVWELTYPDWSQLPEFRE